MQRSKDELMKEVSDLRKQLAEVKNVSNDSKNSQIRMNEKLNNYDLAIQDLKDQLAREQNKNNSLNDNLIKVKHENKA